MTEAGIYNVPFLHLNLRRFLAGSSWCLRRNLALPVEKKRS